MSKDKLDFGHGVLTFPLYFDHDAIRDLMTLLAFIGMYHIDTKRKVKFFMDKFFIRYPDIWIQLWNIIKDINAKIIYWMSSYPIKHGGPAFHRDALEDSEHGKKDVVEACYSVIWSDPPFLAHGLIYGTYPRSIRRALRCVPLITRGLTLTFFVDLRWNEKSIIYI